MDDYHKLFGRVSVHVAAEPSPLETAELLEAYKMGTPSPWLEELFFHYGRYLLIACSREKTLPANLQGTWTQFYYSPWSGGYWHNINVQMNYWGAMSANLPECFEAYIAYFKAYLPQAEKYSREYIQERHPERLDDLNGDNGWIIGTGANAYHVPKGGTHSGPGTGGFTAKLLMDYYLFTEDQDFLKEVAYPAMLSLSKFYAKALVERDGHLLVEPSASPEQVATADQIKDMPGHLANGGKRGYYITSGTTFDQGFVWESFNDTLSLAEALGQEDPFLDTIREHMKKLDPILIGESGQIKEFREEKTYSDIGDPTHRHISHLCPLYPGTLINTEQKWMDAAAHTLDLRGGVGKTGWSKAHHMNCRARLGQGEEALANYRSLLATKVYPNLWATHPPFQIDGNFGGMAGVVEMLLQSHMPYIKVLPALPEAWAEGAFSGLVARGNFVVSAKWRKKTLSDLRVTSRSGGQCRLAYPGIASAKVKDSGGQKVDVVPEGANRIAFPTRSGESYIVMF
jgi:alpha-L-fucosidase 2